MAKKKKQRAKLAKAGDISLQKMSAQAKGAPVIASQPETVPPAQASEKNNQKKPSGVVRVSTCVAGMFLTLILGVYLGTLMPDLMQKEASPAMSPNALPSLPPPQAPDPLAQMARDLEQKAAANPNDANVWIELGNAYFDASKPPLAIKAYERALALKPDNADVLTDLGIMYRETGNPEKGLECFKKAITINPAHQNAMYNEGVVLAMDLNRRQDAAAAWERLVNINPQAKAPDGKLVSDMIKDLH